MATDDEQKEIMHRASVSLPDALYQAVQDFKRHIPSTLPISDSEVIRQMLTYAAETHPWLKKK